MSTLALLRIALLTALAGALLASPAQAAHKPRPLEAAATILACGGDSLTIATQLRPAAGAAGQRLRRQIRGARLLMQFEAAPLYGQRVRADEFEVGQATTVARLERLSGLPAQTYAGLVRYRWTRGARTVHSGIVRSSRTRAAGRRGRASCVLPVGRPPADTKPPIVFPIPLDPAWKRGPLDVAFYAVDDHSGVAGVFWRLDAGRFESGRSLRITTQGQHRLEYVARDAAGNQSKPAAVTLRVDTEAPSVPALASPAGTVEDTTPVISWTPSTDAASGVSFYVALVRDAAGTIVFSKAVKAGDPTAVEVSPALAPGAYTAEVVAADGTTPQPFTATGSSAFSVTG